MYDPITEHVLVAKGSGLDIFEQILLNITTVVACVHRLNHSWGPVKSAQWRSEPRTGVLWLGFSIVILTNHIGFQDFWNHVSLTGFKHLPKSYILHIPGQI